MKWSFHLIFSWANWSMPAEGVFESLVIFGSSGALKAWLHVKRQSRDTETHTASCCPQRRSDSVVVRCSPAVEIHTAYIYLNRIYLSVGYRLGFLWGLQQPLSGKQYFYSEEDDWLVRVRWVSCSPSNALTIVLQIDFTCSVSKCIQMLRQVKICRCA